MDGYMIEVECDDGTIRVHAKNKTAQRALTGWEVTLDEAGSMSRGRVHSGAADVEVPRSEIANVTFKSANPLVNGNLTVVTTGGKKYQLHFRRKQQADFERLAHELAEAPGQHVHLGSDAVWNLPGQDGTFGQEVVGESFHVAQFDLLLKGIHVDSNGVDHFEKASLVPEPSNEFDPLAVAVVIRGQTVGHLPREDAATFQPTLLAATKAGRDPQVDSILHARADEHEVGKVWHSVRLDLAPLEVITAK